MLRIRPRLRATRRVAPWRAESSRQRRRAPIPPQSIDESPARSIVRSRIPRASAARTLLSNFPAAAPDRIDRSEERRVGKEWRARWSAGDGRKKKRDENE